MATPRRTVVGWDSARLSMILAVLESRCGLGFGGLDVYLNVAGGLKISEPAADLAVATALISARENVALPTDTVFFGEISLSGALRPTAMGDQRIKEAEKLGFTKVFAPKALKQVSKSTIEVNKHGNLNDFIEACFGKIEE